MTIEKQQKDLKYLFENDHFRFTRYVRYLELEQEVPSRYIQQMGVFTLDDFREMCEWDTEYFATITKPVYLENIFSYTVALKGPEELQKYLKMDIWDLPEYTDEDRNNYYPEYYFDDESTQVEPEVGISFTNFRLKDMPKDIGSEVGQR